MNITSPEAPEANSDTVHPIVSTIPSNFRQRRWLLPIVCGVVCALLGYVFVKLTPNSFRSETTLFFPSSGDTGASSILTAINSMGAGGASDKGGSIGLLGGIVTSPQLASGPNTSVAVLQSERCRRDVATKLDLVDYYHKPMNEVLEILNNVVTFGVNRFGLLQIEATDKDPVMAAKLVQTETDSLKIIAGELTSAASRHNREFIYQRLAVTKAQLVRQEALLARLQSRGTLNMTDETQSAKLVGLYADLIGQENQASIDLLTVKAKLRAKNDAAARAANASTNLPADMTYAMEPRQRLRNLEGSFALAEKTLGTENPRYRLLKLELDQARADVNREVSREVQAHNAGITTDVADLYAEESGLAARQEGLAHLTKQLQGKLLRAPVTLAEESRLTADARTTQGVVSMLQTEGERARMVEARDAATFVVFDTPTPAVKPFYPRRGPTTALALLAGMLIGIAWLVADSVRLQRQRSRPIGLTEVLP